MPEIPPRIEVRGVTKRFPGVCALDRVNLKVFPGEVHGIVGENGAGKSTLMRILSGVYADYEGEIFHRNRPVRFRNPRQAEQAGVSIIHQELNLIPTLSAVENLFLGREKTRPGGFLLRSHMKRRASGIFRLLRTDIPPDAAVEDLRIGDRQLVEIAKALALEADVVIMDEPTSALSDTETERLFEVIRTLRAENHAILYISHKMDEIFSITDRITVLRDGKYVDSFETGRTQPRQVISCMVGREIADHFPAHESHRGDEILRVENLSVPDPEHPGRYRVRGISFAMHRGEIVGLAGLMGSGRTEIMEALFGSSPKKPEGNVWLEGSPFPLHSPSLSIRKGLAFVTEDRKEQGLFLNLNVLENVTLANLREALRGLFLSRSREKRMARKVCEDLRIKTPSLETPVEELSGGNQQKVIVGRWLLTNPELLLLDDPTRGIDVGAKVEMYRLMRDLANRGKAILFASSELPEVLALCDRILVLCEGRLSAEFSREEATEELIMAAATQGGKLS